MEPDQKTLGYKQEVDIKGQSGRPQVIMAHSGAHLACRFGWNSFINCQNFFFFQATVMLLRRKNIGKQLQNNKVQDNVKYYGYVASYQLVHFLSKSHQLPAF